MPSRLVFIPGLVGLALVLQAACTPVPTARNGRDAGSLAAAYAAAGRWVEASREIRIALRREPRNASLHLQAADIHEKVGALLRAAENLDSATRLAPTDPGAWAARAAFETRRGRVDSAYVAARRAHQLAPEDTELAFAFARAAERAGLEEEARAVRRRFADPAGDAAAAGGGAE